MATKTTNRTKKPKPDKVSFPAAASRTLSPETAAVKPAAGGTRILSQAERELLEELLLDSEGSPLRWNIRRNQGATDDELFQWIQVELQRGQSIANESGVVSCCTHLGTSAEVWFCPHTERKKRKPDLNGRALVAAVRDVMQIPHPYAPIDLGGVMLGWELQLLREALTAAPGSVERWRTFWVDVHQCQPSTGQVLRQIDSEFRLTAAGGKASRSTAEHCIDWWLDSKAQGGIQFDGDPEQMLVGLPLAKKAMTTLEWMAMDDLGNEAAIAPIVKKHQGADTPRSPGRNGKKDAPVPMPEKIQTSPAAGERFVQMPIDQVIPDPKQPREEFDEAYIDELAGSVRQVGVLQPLLLRDTPQGPRLVAGECRLRAAKRAGLAAVPCVIRALSDRDVLFVQIEENLKRKGLNEIELAKSYKRLCVEGGLTQDQVATRLGITQGEVSNKIRLLELPADWQQRIISHEITSAMGRGIVPWVEFPRVLKELEKVWKRDKPETGGEFTEALRRATVSQSGTMGDEDYPACAFTPTPEQRAKLQILEVPHRYREGDKAERAFNLPLWEKLQKAAIAEHQKKQAAAAQSKTTGTKGNAGAKRGAKQPKEDLGKKFGEALYTHRIAWLRGRILAALETEAEADELTAQSTFERVLMCLILFCEDPWLIDDSLAKAMGRKKRKPGRQNGDYETEEANRLQSLFQVPPEKWHGLMLSVFQKLFGQDDGTRTAVFRDPWTFERAPLELAKALGVDFLKEWRPDAEFVALWPEDLLRELATRPGFLHHRTPAEVKNFPADYVATVVLNGWPSRYVPRELLTADWTGRFEVEKKAAAKATKAKKKPAKAK